MASEREREIERARGERKIDRAKGRERDRERQREELEKGLKFNLRLIFKNEEDLRLRHKRNDVV